MFHFKWQEEATNKNSRRITNRANSNSSYSQRNDEPHRSNCQTQSISHKLFKSMNPLTVLDVGSLGYSHFLRVKFFRSRFSFRLLLHHSLSSVCVCSFLLDVQILSFLIWRQQIIISQFNFQSTSKIPNNSHSYSSNESKAHTHKTQEEKETVHKRYGSAE